MHLENTAMSSGRADFLFQRLRQLAITAPAVPTPDDRLLERFTGQSDETAFAALVQRHGAMVWNVGRRVLHDEHEAEDVFQAAFLILAQKAGTICRRQSVGSWLYGVAYHLAIRARANAARRQKLAHKAADRPGSDPLAEVSGRELVQVLDAELQRLPERLRAPLLLCYLEGQSQEEAAEQLGWSKTTLRGRLECGRELLRYRLSRRGLALSSALLPAALATNVTAAVPLSLPAATAHAAILFTDGSSTGAVSPSVLALVQGMIRTMLLTRLRAAVLLVTIGLLGVGAAALAHHTLADRQPAQPDPVAAQAPPQAEPAPGVERPAIDRYGDPLPPGALARLGTVRLRHGGAVTGVVFTPDGKAAISVSQDARAHLWDVGTGQELRCYFPKWAEEFHSLMAQAVALTPDGRTLAVAYGNSDESIQLFDFATGRELLRLKGHKGSVYAVAFLPGGRLVSAALDDTIRVWDTATGKELRRLEAGHQPLRHLAMAANGKIMASSGDDDVIRVWDIATGKKLHEWKAKGADKEACELALAPDGRTLVASAGENTLNVWDVATGRIIRTLKGHGPLAFSPGGTVLAGTGTEGPVQLWKVATGEELRNIPAGWHQPVALAFAPDGRSLLTGGWEGTVRLWDLATGKERSAARGHEASVRVVACAPDGKTVVTGSADGTVRYWDPATGEERRQQNAARDLNGGPGLPIMSIRGGRVDTLAYSPDGRLLAIGGPLVIRLCDPTTGAVRRVLPLGETSPFLLQFAPDGKTIATAGSGQDRQHHLYLWDVATGKLVRTFPGQSSFIRALAFSPDGKLLASTCQDKARKVRLWDVATGKLIRELAARTDSPIGVAFAPDGSAVATGSDDPRSDDRHTLIQMWDPATGRELPEFRGASMGDLRLAFSPDGKTLAAAGGNGQVQLWEVATRRLRGRFIGHVGYLHTLAFAPDGRALITGSDDTTALVWDLTGGRRSAHPLTDAQWRAAWEELGDADAVKAYRAMWTLATAARTVPALRERLRPLSPEVSVKIRQWIKDLDSDQFTVRDQATAALEKQGYLAEPALRQALAGDPGVEVRQRVERLLARLANPSADRLRELRALEALGHAGTPGARSLLEALAAGPPSDRLTRDARGLLERRRPPADPAK
jgi:RNA polymerase sigma factor (sigma-70 family)